MWCAASNPNFVLTGKFRELVVEIMSQLLTEFFRRAAEEKTFLADVYNEVETDYEDTFFMEWQPVFDALPTRDKITLFARTLRAMTDENSPPPERTQYSESAVYAIFEALYCVLFLEIEEARVALESGHDPYTTRRLVSLVEKEYVRYTTEPKLAEAVMEISGETLPTFEHIDYTNDDLEEWDRVIDALGNLILRNVDAIDCILADVPKEKSRTSMRILGLPKDYYTQVLEPVSEQEFYADVVFLKTFCEQDDDA